MTRAILLLALLWAAPLSAQVKASPDDIATLQSCVDELEPTAGPDACLGVIADPCQAQDGGGTTVGMTECFLQEAAAWDHLLNRYYGIAMPTGPRDPGTFAGDLLAAQRAWIGFRDAECAMQYTRWGDGSMRTIAGAICQAELVARRTMDLRALTEGV